MGLGAGWSWRTAAHPREMYELMNWKRHTLTMYASCTGHRAGDGGTRALAEGAAGTLQGGGGRRCGGERSPQVSAFVFVNQPEI